jgi:hypothetical protein
MRRSHLYNLMAAHATRQLKTGRCARGGRGGKGGGGEGERWARRGAAAELPQRRIMRRQEDGWRCFCGRISEQKKLVKKVRSEGYRTVSRACDHLNKEHRAQRGAFERDHGRTLRFGIEKWGRRVRNLTCDQN